jgi:hypothetical protein
VLREFIGYRDVEYMQRDLVTEATIEDSDGRRIARLKTLTAVQLPR